MTGELLLRMYVFVLVAASVAWALTVARLTALWVWRRLRRHRRPAHG